MFSFTNRGQRVDLAGWMFAVCSSVLRALAAAGGPPFDTAGSALIVDPSVGSGVIVQESSNHGRCTSTPTTPLDAATCPGINNLGGGAVMIPGHAVTTTISLRNVGDVPVGTLALAAQGPCMQAPASSPPYGSATDLCSRIHLSIASGERILFAGTAKSLGRSAPAALVIPGSLHPGARATVTFIATLDQSCGNDYQHLGATLPITWTFEH